MPFDLSMTKLLILGVLAMLIFGPDKLPQLARDAGRMLRQFRTFAQQARTDLKSELGDTVGDFDITDLNPRNFVRKHLLDDVRAEFNAPVGVAAVAGAAAGIAAGAAAGAAVATARPAIDLLPAGTPAPFDTDAT